MISERISSTSSGPKKINKAAQVYNTARKISGYRENIEYRKIETTQKTLGKKTPCGMIPPAAST